jgi:hypothetical protein
VSPLVYWDNIALLLDVSHFSNSFSYSSRSTITQLIIWPLEVRQLIFALANKVAGSNTELVAQAVGNALYGCQMMTSDHEEVNTLFS